MSGFWRCPICGGRMLFIAAGILDDPEPICATCRDWLETYMPEARGYSGIDDPALYRSVPPELRWHP